MEVETKTYRIRVRCLWNNNSWSDEIETVPFDPAGRWARENRVCEAYCQEMVDKNKKPNLVGAIYLGPALAGA